VAGLGDLSQLDQYLVLVGFLGIVGAGAYWNFVYSGKETNELAPMEIRVELLDSLNQQARSQMNQSRINALRAEADEAERTLSMMRQLVPSGNEVPALLDQVSDAGRRAGLEIAGVQPQPIIEGDQFDTYRYKITVIGSYHKVGEFLANIGSLTRIMAPTDLQLEVASTEAARARARRDEVPLQTVFELQTYVAKAGSPADRRARTS
jgi:type IV pilus assembly protein PilO